MENLEVSDNSENSSKGLLKAIFETDSNLEHLLRDPKYSKENLKQDIVVFLDSLLNYIHSSIDILHIGDTSRIFRKWKLWLTITFHEAYTKDIDIRQLIATGQEVDFEKPTTPLELEHNLKAACSLDLLLHNPTSDKARGELEKIDRSFAQNSELYHLCRKADTLILQSKLSQAKTVLDGAVSQIRANQRDTKRQFLYSWILHLQGNIFLYKNDYSSAIVKYENCLSIKENLCSDITYEKEGGELLAELGIMNTKVKLSSIALYHSDVSAYSTLKDICVSLELPKYQTFEV